jgi:hypothetical protein
VIYYNTRQTQPAKGQEPPNTRRFYTEPAVKCGYYYGQDTQPVKAALLAQARKESGYSAILNAAVTEARLYSETQVFKFDLANMQTARARRFDTEEGAVYKLILADKNKISRLSNYTYDQLPQKLEQIMRQNSLTALPTRISVYEDYSPGARAALAVFVFSAKQKYLAEISDLNQSGRVYDLQPDYAVKYTGAD